MPIIKIVNAETGEEIEREMTNKELSDYEQNKLLFESEAKEKESVNLAKKELLEKLGITESEARLLLS